MSRLRKTEFITKVTEKIQDKLGDNYIVTNVTVNKNNETTNNGINIREINENVSPNIYLDGAYEQYKDGRDFSDIIDCILDAYEDAKVSMKKQKDMIDEVADGFKDFEKAKDKIIMRVVNKERNAKELADKLFIPYLDFAVTFRYLVSNTSDGIMSTLIDKKVLDDWNVTIDELTEIAAVNTAREFPSKCTSMLDVIINELDEDFAKDFKENREFYETQAPPMYVLTNVNGINGATNLLYYREGFDELADKFDSDLYLLPSSIHEVIIVPKKGNTKEDLAEIVQYTNYTAVTAEDFLSNSVYIFNRETRQITIAE